MAPSHRSRPRSAATAASTFLALGLNQPLPSDLGAIIWHARQEIPSGAWSAWANAGKPGTGIVGVCSILDAEQHGHILALGDGGRLWFKERGPDDAFSAWEPLGGPLRPRSRPQPGLRDGFCRPVRSSPFRWPHRRGRRSGFTQRAGFFYRSRPAASTAWTAWRSLGDNGFIGEIAAAVSSDDARMAAPPARLPSPVGQRRPSCRTRGVIPTAPGLTGCCSANRRAGSATM